MAQLERSIEFYRNLIGLEVERPRYRMGEGVAELYGAPGIVMEAGVLKLRTADSELILIEARGGASEAMPGLGDRGAIRLLFEVSDFSAMLSRLKAANVRNLLPERTGETRLALVRDPDGLFVELKPAQAAVGEEPRNITFSGL